MAAVSSVGDDILASRIEWTREAIVWTLEIGEKFQDKESPTDFPAWSSLQNSLSETLSECGDLTLLWFEELLQENPNFVSSFNPHDFLDNELLPILEKIEDIAPEFSSAFFEKKRAFCENWRAKFTPEGRLVAPRVEAVLHAEAVVA